MNPGEELFRLINELIDQRVFGKPRAGGERDDYGHRRGHPVESPEVDAIREQFMDWGKQLP